MNDDPFTQTRLDVAEMKGMLTQALGSHSQRLTALEEAKDQMHARISDKGKTLANHAARLEDLEERAKGQLPRIAQIVTVIISVVGFLAAVGGDIVLRR